MDGDRKPKARRTPADRAPEPIADFATVIVTMQRATGKVEIDATFATPGEAAVMLNYADEIAAEQLAAANGRELAGDE